MPYGYFKLVRFTALIGFLLLAFLSFGENKKKEMIIYCFLAILFQPFYKFYLGRYLWNIVDVITSIFLAITIFLDKQDKQ